MLCAPGTLSNDAFLLGAIVNTPILIYVGNRMVSLPFCGRRAILRLGRCGKEGRDDAMALFEICSMCTNMICKILLISTKIDAQKYCKVSKSVI